MSDRDPTSAGRRLEGRAPDVGGDTARPDRDRALLGLLVATLLVNVLAMPALRYAGDPTAWEMEAESLVQRGELAVPSEIIAYRPLLGHFFVFNADSGRYYSKYGIGNTVAWLLPLAFERLVLGVRAPTDPMQLFGERGEPYLVVRRVALLNGFNLLLGLLLALTLYRLAALYTVQPRSRVGFVLACFYSTFLWNYLRAQTTEIYQCLLFSAALLFLLRFLRRARDAKPGAALAWSRSRDLLWSALSLAGLCLVKLAYLPLWPVWLAAVALGGLRHGDAKLRFALTRTRREIRLLLCYVVAPLAAMVLVLLLANELRFGSPFKLGYEREANLFGAKWSESVPGYLFDPRWSMFVHFPVLAIALFGLPRLWHRARLELVLTWTMFAVLFAINSSYYYWQGEGCYGPRYLLFALPALSLPFVGVLDGLASQRGLLRRWLPVGAIVLVLGTSAWLQTQVNALEFHTYYRLKAVLHEFVAGDAEAIQYLAYRNTAQIHRDFLRYREGGPVPIPMRQAATTLPPARFAQLEARVRSLLGSNYYWAGRRPGEP